MNTLYGAWISKKEFIPVAEECHAEKALELLNAKQGTKFYSIYRIMYRLGFVRLVYLKDGYAVEYWEHAKLTRYQMEVIAEAKQAEKVSIYYRQNSNLTLTIN